MNLLVRLVCVALLVGTLTSAEKMIHKQRTRLRPLGKEKRGVLPSFGYSGGFANAGHGGFAANGYSAGIQGLGLAGHGYGHDFGGLGGVASAYNLHAGGFGGGLGGGFAPLHGGSLGQVALSLPLVGLNAAYDVSGLKQQNSNGFGLLYSKAHLQSATAQHSNKFGPVTFGPGHGPVQLAPQSNTYAGLSASYVPSKLQASSPSNYLSGSPGLSQYTNNGGTLSLQLPATTYSIPSHSTKPLFTPSTIQASAQQQASTSSNQGYSIPGTSYGVPTSASYKVPNSQSVVSFDAHSGLGQGFSFPSINLVSPSDSDISSFGGHIQQIASSASYSGGGGHTYEVNPSSIPEEQSPKASGLTSSYGDSIKQDDISQYQNLQNLIYNGGDGNSHVELDAGHHTTGSHHSSISGITSDSISSAPISYTGPTQYSDGHVDIAEDSHSSGSLHSSISGYVNPSSAEKGEKFSSGFSASNYYLSASPGGEHDSQQYAAPSSNVYNTIKYSVPSQSKGYSPN